mgnify:CR=1 FL=1
MRKMAVGFVLFLFIGVVSASPVFTVYTDRLLWDSAITGMPWTSTETFDMNTIHQPWLAISSDYPGAVTNNRWESRVDDDPLLQDTFHFAVPGIALQAFGADFNLAVPGGPGTGIRVSMFLGSGGTEYFVGEMANTTQSFWGFVVQGGSFDYVRLTAGTQSGIQETYWTDNLSIAGVPEPGTYLLVGAGLLAFGLWRRRFR